MEPDTDVCAGLWRNSCLLSYSWELQEEMDHGIGPESKEVLRE